MIRMLGVPSSRDARELGHPFFNPPVVRSASRLPDTKVSPIPSSNCLTPLTSGLIAIVREHVEGIRKDLF